MAARVEQCVRVHSFWWCISPVGGALQWRTIKVHVVVCVRRKSLLRIIHRRAIALPPAAPALLPLLRGRVRDGDLMLSLVLHPSLLVFGVGNALPRPRNLACLAGAAGRWKTMDASNICWRHEALLPPRTNTASAPVPSGGGLLLSRLHQVVPIQPYKHDRRMRMSRQSAVRGHCTCFSPLHQLGLWLPPGASATAGCHTGSLSARTRDHRVEAHACKCLPVRTAHTQLLSETVLVQHTPGAFRHRRALCVLLLYQTGGALSYLLT
jgi:hypothetical protein